MECVPGMVESFSGLALVVRTLLEFLPQLVQNFSFFLTVQLLLQLLKSDGDDVVVVGSGKSRIGGCFEPNTMEKIEILISQSRRVWPKIILTRHSVRQPDFHYQPWLRIRQALPCVTGKLGLLIGT